MTIARYYDPSKNPDNAHLPGVPLGDIDEDRFAEYPAWLQESIDASPMYRKTKPTTDRVKSEKVAAKDEKPEKPSDTN